MKRFILPAALLALALIGSAYWFWPQTETQRTYISDNGTVAIGGYDAVSYFEGDGVPQRGDARYAVDHGGAVYRFASADNARRFAADPSAFVPQYGGHCAWAMARDYFAPGDPLQYAIVDGRLFLNYNAEIKARWDRDRAGFVAAGDANWSKLPVDPQSGA